MYDAFSSTLQIFLHWIMSGTMVIILSCIGFVSEHTGFFSCTGKIYNATDGRCSAAQEPLDFYVDGKKIATIESGGQIEYTLPVGTYEFSLNYAGTLQQVDTTTYNVIAGGWWYSWGCDDGTHPLKNGNMKLGFGKIPYSAPISIDYVEWYMDSVDRKYWDNGYPATMLVDFNFRCSGDFDKDDISAVFIEMRKHNILWPHPALDDGSNIYDEKRRLLLPYHEYEHSLSLDSEGTILPVGKFYVKAVFKDGSVNGRDFWINVPGQKSNGDIEFIASQESKIQDATKIAKALTRPEIISAARDGGRLIITFMNSDPRAKNGLIWFLDREKNFIGITGRYFADCKYLDRPIAGLGSRRTASISQGDISFYEISKTKSLSEIAFVIVVVYDSFSSKNGDSGYHRAYSPAAELR